MKYFTLPGDWETIETTPPFYDTQEEAVSRCEDPNGYVCAIKDEYITREDWCRHAFALGCVQFYWGPLIRYRHLVNLISQSPAELYLPYIGM